MYIVFLFCCLTAIAVFISNNSIYSTLFFILVTLEIAIIIISTASAYIGFLYIIIYLGAVCVLILFVIMMLNIRISELKNRIVIYSPIALFIVGTLGIIMIYFFLNDNQLIINWIEDINIVTIYTKNFWNEGQLALISYFFFKKITFLFFIGGLLLLEALLCVVVLTHRNKIGKSKRQDYYKQMNKDSKKSIRYFK